MKNLEKIKSDLFYKMLRIRRVQERIETLYLKDEMKTPVHLYIGQEAIAVGFCHLLKKSDFISSNHRSHGHYLAKGGNLKKLIAELHCKKSGCSKGFGGSMHLVDVSVGHMGSSSIVGGGISIGTGHGLSFKMKKKDNVSVVFFGDGAADEGVLYESINFSILKKLPVIYVLENNKWSVCSHVKSRQATENVFHNGVSEEFLYTRKIDGNKIEIIFETAQICIERARNGKGPSFVECDTYRILGHAGCEAQDPEGYRDSCEIKEWKQRCPIAQYQMELEKEGVLTSDLLQHMEETISNEIDDAFQYAMEAELPTVEDLNNHLFSE